MGSSENELRRNILDTARSLLVSGGYTSLSMRKIARRIGYSATTLYLYFENKDRLIHSLIDEGMQALFGALSTAFETNLNPVERIRAMALEYVRFGIDNPEYYEIMFQLRPQQMERYPAEMYRRARRNLQLFQDTLVEGAESGELSVADPELVTNAVWASVHGLVTLLLAERVDKRIQTKRFTHLAIDQFIAGLILKKELQHSS